MSLLTISTVPITMSLQYEMSGDVRTVDPFSLISVIEGGSLLNFKARSVAN